MEKELRINLTSAFDSKGIDNAKRSFSELERESLRAVSSQKSIGSSSSDAARSVDNLSDRIGFMGHAYVGFQTIVAGSSTLISMTKSAIQQADTWNLLDGRLKLVTDSTSELVFVQNALFNISQESRTGYAENADLYARIARATQELNKTQYENLDVTEAISKSFIISGSSAESAKAAVIQLGQGFASGTLRGEELNSVLEQAPRLAEAIAKGMGVTVGQLKNMGAEGKLTAEKVFEAILNQKNAIEQEFGEMPVTVGQSLATLTNQIGKTIHEFDKMHGVTAGIGSGISDLTKLLAENGDKIGDYAGYVGDAVAILLVWKVGTIAFNGIQAAYSAYLATSTITTTSYSLATNMATTSVARLSIAQTAAVASTRALALAAANPITATIIFAAVLTAGFQSARNFIEGDKVDPRGSAALRAAIAKTKELSSIEAQARSVGKNYNELSETLNRQIGQRATLVKSGVDTKYIDAAIAKTKTALKDTQKVAKDFYSIVGGEQPNIPKPKPNAIPLSGDKPKTGKSPKVSQAEKDAKELAAMEQRMLEENINRGIKRFEEEIKAQEKFDHDIAQGQLTAITNRTLAHQDGVLKIEAAERALSMKMLDISGDWYTAESVRIGEQYNELEAAGVEKLRLQQFLSDSMAALDKEQIEKLKNDTIKLNTVFEDAFKSMEDSMVNMFMTGKFEAEDFFNTIIEGMIRMQIRNSITQPLTTAIGGMDFGAMFSGMFAAYDGGIIPTYAVGGYTGDGGKYEPKGVVHGGEYVIPQWMVQKSPALIGSLESTRKRGYADGGFVGSALSSASAPAMPVTINIENKSGTAISAENTDVRFDGKGVIVGIVVDAITRDVGGMRSAIRGVR